MERETGREVLSNYQTSHTRGGEEILAIPVWLHATASYYKKLNRIAEHRDNSRYEALCRGLDARLRQYQSNIAAK